MTEKELMGSDMWLPKKEGENLKGEVMDITEGMYGKQYLLKKADGETVLTPSHKVLQTRLLKVKVGQVIRIQYEGDEPPKLKGQNPTKMYRAFLDD